MNIKDTVAHLLELLDKFPPSSRFIPVQDKNPSVNGGNWQGKTLDATEIIEAWQVGKTPATGRSFNGIGLVLAPPFVAIDHDGTSCDRLIEELSGMSVEDALPLTLTIASGKPGRYQAIYAYDGELTHKKIETGVKGEQLEIRRGDSKQSVIFGAHPETDGYRVVKDVAIAPLPKWVIDVASGTAAGNDTPLLSLPAPSPRRIGTAPPIPLERCLSRSHRDQLDRGVAEGGRNDAAIAIAIDAAGCERWLTWERVAYVGDVREVVTTFGGRCSPPIPARELETILKSAQRTGKDQGPSTPGDALRNVIKKWERENRRSSSAPSNTSHEQSTTPSPVGNEVEEDRDEYSYLRERVRDILSTSPDDAAVAIALSRLAKAENLSRRDLDGIANQIRGEQEVVTAPPEVTTPHLDLGYIVPELADAMVAAGKANGVDPVMFLHYLLPAVGTLLGSGVKVEVSPGHVEPCILWSSAIEDSGLGKTRAYQMIDRWLVKKQEAEIERWAVENRTYKMALTEWQREQKKQGADNTEPPEPPTPPRRYSVVTATMEALVGAMAAQKGKGVLWFRDELAGLFSSFDQYTKGKSEHLETFLQAYDGGSLNVLRRNLDDCIFAPVSHLCVAGGIQPAMVSKIFSDPNDPQGLQARFQFLMPQAVDRRYQRSRAPLTLPGMLDDIFDSIDGRTNAVTVALTDSAFGLWADYYDAMQLRAKDSNPAAAAWLRKHASRTARMALALHAIDLATGRVKGLDADWIDVATMERAIALGEFYRGQFESLQRQSTQDENDLSSLLYRLQQQAQRTGRLTVRQVQQGSESKLIRRVAEIRGWRPSEVIKSLFRQAGAGFESVTEGTTVALVYKATPPETPPTEPPPPPEPEIPPIVRVALTDLHEVEDESGLLAAIAFLGQDLYEQAFPHLPPRRQAKFTEWMGGAT